MYKTLLILLLSASSVLSASRLQDFAAFDSSRANKVIFADSFESRHKQLKHLPKAFEIKRGYGQNATGGLKLSRALQDKYSFVSYDIKFKPQTRYKITMDIRAIDLTDHKGKAIRAKKTHLGGIDLYKGKKWIKGFYIVDNPVKGQIPDWKTYSLTFDTPEDFTDGKFALTLHNKKYCKAVFWDNVVITEMGEPVPLIYPILPKTLHPDKAGNLKLRIYDFDSSRSEKQLLLFAVINGREFQSDVRNGFANFKIGQLPVGEHQLKLYLADTVRKRIIGEESYPLFVSGKEAPAGTTVLAEDSRILVDGKPFFPIGFYFERTSRISRQRLRELKAVGVNTILPNRSFAMTIGQKSKKAGLKSVRKSLDYLHKYDMKVIMSMLEFIGSHWKRVPVYDGITDNYKQAEHLVSNLWNHPAILAWYVADENPIDELGMVRNLRYSVSRHDPFHPVATLTDKKDNYIFYGPTGDFLMSDRYPVRYKKDPQSMTSVHESLEQALTDGRIGNWFVPQCFNWGIYKRHENYEDFRYPTELEIRSQCLAALNHRVRGIIFYAYDAFIRQEAYGPEGAFSKQWPKTANVIKLLVELEPFFMSLNKTVDLDVVSQGDSKVEAVRHSADGKEIVVITSDGPGRGDAVIHAGRTGLKSRFGFTKELGGGRYHFKSVEIASDILE